MARLVDVVWFLLLAGGSAAYCVTAAAKLGATFDEPFYIATGIESWRSGSTRAFMAKGTMPLPVDVQTLPLYLRELDRGEAYTNPYAVMPELLPVARAMNLVFWWLLLFYGLRWGRLLGGPWAGRLACGLIAVEPNLLAHAMLATTDIALTGTVLATSYHWYANRNHKWVWRVIVPGLWYGAALTSKASAFAFVPILWFVLGLCHLYLTQPFHWRTAWSATRRLRWDLVYALSLGFVLTFAYCGCDWDTEPTFIEWARSLDDGPGKSEMISISENLPIFSNAGEGLVQQIKHNFRGHGAYILGEYHTRAVWYYFPVALSIKLPDAVMLLFAYLLGLRPRALLNPAGWVTLALLLFSMNARVQIGVRLVFPLIAFLLITLAVAGVQSQDGKPWRRIILGLALVLTMLTSAVVWPDPLRHVNQLWGGLDRGPKLVADSNYDWGQGLPELQTWWTTNQEPSLHVWYYGTDPAILFPPFRRIEVHKMPNVTPQTLTVAVGEGYLAVSLTALYASPDRKPATLAVVNWLHTLEPVGRTRTFVIYKLR